MEVLVGHMYLSFNQFRQMKFWTELNDIDNLIDLMKFSSHQIEIAPQEQYCHTKSFHDSISDFFLIDLPLTNIHHTWSNFRAAASCSRIDRNSVTKEWMEKLLKTHLKGLPRLVSDHVSLIIDTNHPKGGPTPFRFENMWFLRKELKQNIQKW